MALSDMDRPIGSYDARRRAERREDRLILSLVYIPFLALAVVNRLASLAMGRRGTDATRRSVFAEARADALSIPFTLR